MSSWFNDFFGPWVLSFDGFGFSFGIERRKEGILKNIPLNPYSIILCLTVLASNNFDIMSFSSNSCQPA